MKRVKQMARSGFKSFVKPAIKKGFRTAKNTAIGAAKAYGNEMVDGAIRGAGMAASVKTGTPLPSMAAEAGIKQKDMLLQKYFGAQSNKGSSHSGKNYAIKRKPAVRYPTKESRMPGERTVKPMPTSIAATLRNTDQTYSASHPTGGKI
jgi:hypothetical protein